MAALPRAHRSLPGGPVPVALIAATRILATWVAGFLLLTGCARQEKATHAWFAMDTDFSASLYRLEESRASVPPDSAFRRLEAESRRLEVVFSDYLPFSALSGVRGRAGDTVAVPAPELVEVLRAAEEMALASEGLFDVTLHSLKEAWGLSSGDSGRVPDSAAIAAAMRGNPALGSKPGDHPALFPPFKTAGGRVAILRDSVILDLGGIAKGYAVDRLHALLDSLGYRTHLVQAGGDMRVAGLKPGGAWRIGIRHPRRPDTLAGALRLEASRAVSTSGDYERAFVRGGARYHHIFDPRTGRPAAGPWASVTVVAPTSLAADALTEPLFILGPSAAARGLLSRHGAEAVWMRPEGEGLCRVTTAGLAGRAELPGIPECREPGP